MGQPNKRKGLSPRTFVQLPHDVGTHPDNADLGLEAFGLYCLCLAWSGGEWTDGRLKLGAIKQAAARSRVDTPWRELADELVRAGRWERSDDADYPYVITHWATYQMTKAGRDDETRKRQKAAELAKQSVKHGTDGRFESSKSPSGDGHMTEHLPVTPTPALDGQVTEHMPEQVTVPPSGDGESTGSSTVTAPPRRVDIENIDSLRESGAVGAESVNEPKRKPGMSPSREAFLSRIAPQDDEAPFDYRARLKREYSALDINKSTVQPRQDIAYAWAAHQFGPGRADYKVVIAALRRAGSIDAFMSAITRAAEHGDTVDNALKYAMGVSRNQDQRRGQFRTVTAAGGDVNDLYKDFDR